MSDEQSDRLLNAVQAIAISPADAKAIASHLREQSERDHPHDSEHQHQERVAIHVVARYCRYAAASGGVTALAGVILGIGTALAMGGGGAADIDSRLRHDRPFSTQGSRSPWRPRDPRPADVPPSAFIQEEQMKVEESNVARRLVATTMVLLATGCSGGPKGMIKTYLNQEDCSARSKFILEPEKNERLLLDYYKTKNTKQCVTEYKALEEEGCEGKAVGDYCTVFARGANQRYEVKRLSDGYKVDFRGTYGVGPTSVTELMAKWNAKVAPADVVLRAKVEITDLYTGTYSDLKDSHIAAKLQDPTTSRYTVGYAPRSSEAGRALTKILADGKEHRLMVQVSYDPRTRSADEIDINRVVQDSWRQRADEDVVRSPAGHLPASLFVPSSSPPTR